MQILQYVHPKRLNAANSDVFPLHDLYEVLQRFFLLQEPHLPMETWSKNIKMKNSLNILVLLGLNV